MTDHRSRLALSVKHACEVHPAHPNAASARGREPDRVMTRTRRKLEVPMTTLLLHLGLLVRDQQRSLRFYATYFGFDSAGARRYPDGTVIVRNAQGFDLALHPGDPPERLPAFVHFGFQLPDADAVGALLARMEADGVPILERWDEPGYVAFKCLDPDGWRVEVYWEPVT
jgi:catechol 2,3-dioxygenase-like lactoylglutathione lyase family enzyme